MKKKRVVVTGLGVVSCFGNNVEDFYASLLEGKSGVKKIDKFSCEEFSTRIAADVAPFSTERYLDNKQARRMDPFMTYGVAAGKEALADAFPQHRSSGKLDISLDGLVDLKRCGAIVSSGIGGMTVYCEGVKSLSERGKVSPFLIPYTITNMCSALLAIELGLMGPNYSISTACASGSHSIFAAANHIRNGDADLMICGGSEAPVTPIGLAGFIASKTLSKQNDTPEKAAKPWDVERDGFVLGGGAGVLVLESLEHALDRGAKIYAEYLDGAVNCDAFHITSPRTGGECVKNCIEEALEKAQVDKSRVRYINAHATCTQAGDVIELEGINKVFPSVSELKMNATKSMIGHTLGAAGAIEAIVVVKAIETGRLHPTINSQKLDSNVLIDPLIDGNARHWIDVAISNSFGFGGHNAILVFSGY